MAAPVVATQTEGAVTTAGTSHTVTFPASSVSGDLIACLFTTAAVQATMTAGDGFSKLQLDPEAGNHWFALFYKQINGTEGGNFVVTTGGSTKSAWTVHRITGHIDPATQAPEKSTIAIGTSTAPNATIVTPTGGPKDFLYLTSFRQSGEEADDNTWITSQPTGYTWVSATVGHQKTTGTATAASTNCQIGTAYKETTNTSSDDPGVWAVAQSLAWQATVIAIHPAGGGAVVYTAWRNRPKASTLARDNVVLRMRNQTFSEPEGSPYQVSRITPLWQVPRMRDPVQMDVTTSWSAALTKAQIFQRLLEVTTSWAVSMTTVFGKLLAVSDAWGVSMTRLPNKVLAVSSTFASTMTKMIPKTLAVTTAWGAEMVKKVFKSLDIASDFVASLADTAIFQRTLAVTTSWAAGLSTLFIPFVEGVVVSIVTIMRRVAAGHREDE